MLLLPRSPAGKASRARRTRTQCMRWRVRLSGTAGCRSGPQRGRQGRGKRAFGLFFNVHDRTTRRTSRPHLASRPAAARGRRGSATTHRSHRAGRGRKTLLPRRSRARTPVASSGTCGARLGTSATSACACTTPPAAADFSFLLVARAHNVPHAFRRSQRHFPVVPAPGPQMPTIFSRVRLTVNPFTAVSRSAR